MGSRQTRPSAHSHPACSASPEPELDPLTRLERDATAEHRRELSRADEMTREHPPVPQSTLPPSASYAYQSKPLPVDDEGYVEAVPVKYSARIAQVFAEYGVVAVAGCLDADECAASRDALWDFLERHAPPFEPRLDRTRPETWANANWPGLQNLGILGDNIALHPQLMRNRVNPRVVDAFAAVLGTREIWINVGRVSAMRPTLRVLIPIDCFDGTRPNHASVLASAERTVDSLGRDCLVTDQDVWRTIEGWLHLDFNPLTGEATSFSWHHTASGENCYDDSDRNEKVQGILALKDCSLHDGGFHCVPGFVPHVRAWAQSHGDQLMRNVPPGSTTVQVPVDDPLRKDIQRIPIRAGTLVIWSSATPHGTFPNHSDSMRMIQYIKATRRDQSYWRPLFRRALLPDGFVPTLEEAALLGIT